MNGPLRLAIKYVVYNKLKTAVLVACLLLTALLPITIKLLLNQFNQKILARADSTPVVIGAKGSSLDLALHSLYFQTANPPEMIELQELKRIRQSGLAQAIPIHAKFTARGFPVVGTSIDYFSFRGLNPEQGELFAILGECVVGSQVAAELGLAPGDQLLTDRENILDIAGLYPLKMNVVGILEPSRTADDQAVFIDLKTAWVIQGGGGGGGGGLGHGHQDLSEETDESKLLSRKDNSIVASAAVLPYTEITEANIDSFHFHGELDGFPVTSIIAIPDSTKSEIILEGQYDVGEKTLQFVKPSIVVRDLMNMIFRVKLFFDANTIMITISTLLLMILVIILSLRLRQKEMQTMFKIGCSRGTIAMLQIWEMSLVFLIALILLAFCVWGIWTFSGELVESLLLNAAG
jgi:putative ABC transport system permease protein